MVPLMGTSMVSAGGAEISGGSIGTGFRYAGTGWGFAGLEFPGPPASTLRVKLEPAKLDTATKATVAVTINMRCVRTPKEALL